MKALVVGAGMAGLTLAGGLCARGRAPVIIERSTASEAGYAIGLYPLGGRVLRALGTYDELLARALSVARYELANGSGAVLQALDMSVLTGAVGPMLMVSRPDLVHVLELSCTTADLRRGVTIASLVQHADAVDVTFDDGTDERFDAVIACDGIGSTTRDLVFGPARGFDSGWVAWTWWANAERFDPEVVPEWWGAGAMFGVYPVRGRVMCCAVAPAAALAGDDARSVMQRLLSKLIDRVPSVGAAIDEVGTVYRWPMRDVRSDRWVEGRVALCGDSAVGFLPTAGVGASNAMSAATALADELSRADSGAVPSAFERFETRCRSLVEGNQIDSRRLARAMFIRSAPIAWLRDQLARRYPAERMLRQIIDSNCQPF